MARKKGKGIIKTDHVWKFFGDGIWEIGLGLIAIWGGVLVRLQWSILWLVPSFVFFFLVYWLKKKFVFPHAKNIRLPKIRKRVTTELIILTLVVLFGLLTILKVEPGLPGYWSYVQENSLTLIGVLSALTCLFIGFITKISNFYLHAIMLLLTFFLDASVFKAQPIGLVIGAGIVMVFSGIYLLRQFILVNQPKAK
jgi:hypothetical protein